MRAPLLRPTAAVAVLSAVALSPTASAAAKPLLLTDPAGDAFLNDQGTDTFGGLPGPSQDSKDVVSLTLAPLPGKRCTGYTAVLELAGPPSPNTNYRILGRTDTNTTMFWLQYDNNPIAGTATKLRFSSTADPDVDLHVPARVDGSKITFTVLERDVKAGNEKLAALKIDAPGVDIRTSTGFGTVPSHDTLLNEDKSFKVCG
jgi:hypothetical protein